MRTPSLLLSAALLAGTGNANTIQPTTSSLSRENCLAVNGALQNKASCVYTGLRGDRVTVTSITPETCEMKVSDRSLIVARNCNAILRDLRVK